MIRSWVEASKETRVSRPIDLPRTVRTFLRQMSELVKDKVGDGLGDARLLKGGNSERTVDLRLRQL